MGKGKILLPVLVCVASKFIAIFLYNYFCWDSYWNGDLTNDLNCWIDFLSRTENGQIPYVDFSREYPPLAGFFFYSLRTILPYHDFTSFAHFHAYLITAIDSVNTLVFALILKRLQVTRMWLPLILFSLNLTTLILSPFRFDALLVLTILVGIYFLIHDQSYLASLIWGIGFNVKWFTAFLLLILIRRYFSNIKKIVLLCASFALPIVFINLVIGFLVIKHGHSLSVLLDPIKFHLDRALYWDTMMGAIIMWGGPDWIEHYLDKFSLLLMILSILLLPGRSLSITAVFVGCSMLLFNRIYSPQFHLWFYPFLILEIARSYIQGEKSENVNRQEWTKHGNELVITFLVIDFINVSVFPFLFTKVGEEVHVFQRFSAWEHGGLFAAISLWLIASRTLLLVVLARQLLRGKFFSAKFIE